MPKRRPFVAHPIVAALLLGHLVFAAILGVRSAGSLESLELAAYDAFLRMRPQMAPDPRIVIVAETEQDVQRFGHPIPDGTFAEILVEIAAHQPRVIGVDKYRDIPVPPGTDAFHSVLQEHPEVIWIFQFGGEGGGHIAPPAVLEQTDQIGFNDVLDDRDGIVRRGLLFLDDGQNAFYAFPLVLALHYLAADGVYPEADPTHPEYIRIGNTTIRPFEGNMGGYVNADAGGYQFLLDYPGMPQPLQQFSLSQLMDGEVPEGALRDKVVLIGGMAESLPDYVHTPFKAPFRSAPGQRIYGVELHGYITSQLLRFGLDNAPAVRSLTDTKERLWLWLWCIAGALLGLWTRSALIFAVLAGLGIATLVTLCYLASADLLWVPSVPPALGWAGAIGVTTAYLSAREKADRQMLMQLFSRHVSSDVAEAIWRDRDAFIDQGRPRPQRLAATVLFTDIQGFTTISEKMDPQELMQWLNEYMETMAQVVIDHGGVINKYIGDAIMAIFGVPIPRQSEEQIGDDARNAVRCALAMGRALERLNADWHAQGLPKIGMRVGIHTGPLVAGSLGSSQRLEYTVIGDTVNTASRLESFDKAVSDPDCGGGLCRILIGETTRSYLDDRFRTKQVGAVKLKGKEDEVTIYQVALDSAVA